MAAGKPIVATRGAAHEPWLDESRAFMSAPDACSMAAAMLRAHECREHAARVAAAAQSYARQHFGWDRFVEFVRITYVDAMRDMPPWQRGYAA